MNNEISYSEALDKIEAILEQIENGELDVDQIAEQVKNASNLFKICQSKLKGAQEEVEKILKEMNQDEGTAAKQ
ncbi:MAG: exodeoxyribonuclease VII small subunit [Bacteroidales bacterium]